MLYFVFKVNGISYLEDCLDGGVAMHNGYTEGINPVTTMMVWVSFYSLSNRLCNLSTTKH